MSDKKSEEQTNQTSDGADGTDEQGTVLGDEGGVHVGSVEAPEQPPIDFGNFVMSLAHSVLVALGEAEHPELGSTSVDLPTAQHSIQILEMLQEKTQGNLEPEEEKLLGSLLYELRMSYVNASAKKVDTPSDS